MTPWTQACDASAPRQVESRVLIQIERDLYILRRHNRAACLRLHARYFRDGESSTGCPTRRSACLADSSGYVTSPAATRASHQHAKMVPMHGNEIFQRVRDQAAGRTWAKVPMRSHDGSARIKMVFPLNCSRPSFDAVRICVSPAQISVIVRKSERICTSTSLPGLCTHSSRSPFSPARSTSSRNRRRR